MDFSTDMAIDLGTSNTLIYVRGEGIVLNELSLVAIRMEGGPNDRKTIQAVGIDARGMFSETNQAVGLTARARVDMVPGDIAFIRPMKDGVIADFTVTEQMLKHFYEIRHIQTDTSRRIIICVPSGATSMERRVFRECVHDIGPGQVFEIEAPIAAAIGTGLPVFEPTGSMVVDIGGGTTEIGVTSLGDMVYAGSVRIGGDKLDEAIMNYISRNYDMLIGEHTAEYIKKKSAPHFRAPRCARWKFWASTRPRVSRASLRFPRTKSARP